MNLERPPKVGSYLAILLGTFGMIFCLPFLFSSNLADIVGAGFPFVGEECSNQDDKTKLGYFENDGRDFVLAILIKETDDFGEILELKVLMTNGYS